MCVPTLIVLSCAVKKHALSTNSTIHKSYAPQLDMGSQKSDFHFIMQHLIPVFFLPVAGNLALIKGSFGTHFVNLLGFQSNLH